ncbi:hypothetical protein DFI02_101176 [Rhizobium sp. PP-F2F-G20b]|nr:hypothetical protein DFI02_101176 [Rhizobium sp. PP-F2F-G20b]
MTIRLRPHHLLCMLTYIGKGYSPAFVRNYDAIAARIGAGEALDVVDGPDDICRPLLETPSPHCFNDSVIARDRRAAADVAALLGCDIHAGVRLVIDAAEIALLRTHFAAGSIRAACAGCEWSGLCDRIATDGFRAVRVAPADPQDLGMPLPSL